MCADEIKNVNNIADMFKNGDLSGQIRLGYMGNNAEQISVKDTYATAIGGQLKYETAPLNGINLGGAIYTSHAIRSLSGDNDKYDDFLASSEKSYTELAEGYINYKVDSFNFRAGRQLIDTPLADSDDIAMTPHTFEAYVASYEIEDLSLTFIGANVQRWQGVDSDYENETLNSWQDTGVDGTWMAAALYNNSAIETGVWYYDVTKNAKAVYADITGTIAVNDDVNIALGAQYLTENESSQSQIDGTIAGVMAEASFFGITTMLAYDKVSVDDSKQIFEGFGGGSSYTNMINSTAGTLHDGTYGDGSSYVASVGYNLFDVDMSVAYGEFKADAIGAGSKAHISELDIALSHIYNDGEADVTVLYTNGADKESVSKTEYDYSSLQVTLNYNF